MADITKVDYNLIKRLSVILKTLCSGKPLNLDAYQSYAKSTYQLYIEKYPWHPMPPTIHKALRHGHEMAAAAPLPLGTLSEEALEARHKDVKRYIIDNTRKMDRKKRLYDLFRILLVSSDPVVVSYRKPPKPKTRPLPLECQSLVMEVVDENYNEDKTVDEESEDDDTDEAFLDVDSKEDSDEEEMPEEEAMNIFENSGANDKYEEAMTTTEESESDENPMLSEERSEDDDESMEVMLTVEEGETDDTDEENESEETEDDSMFSDCNDVETMLMDVDGRDQFSVEKRRT